LDGSGPGIIAPANLVACRLTVAAGRPYHSARAVVRLRRTTNRDRGGAPAPPDEDLAMPTAVSSLPVPEVPVATSRWLAIVGIGEDGLDSLTAAARTLISTAELVVGGERHLALARDLVRGGTLAWPRPLS